MYIRTSEGLGQLPKSYLYRTPRDGPRLRQVIPGERELLKQ